MLAEVMTARIVAGGRLRALNTEQVEALVASIAEVGLLNPITVYPREVIEGGIAVPGYGLIAGAHRLEACKRLGLVDIAAQVVELPELKRQLAECDENLCGTKLSPAERALFTKRRKEIYEALHPEARHGGATKDAKFASFAADTASKTGQSERAVQLDASRGERVGEDVLGQVIGTDMDKGTVLDALAKAADPEAELGRLRAEKDAEEAKKRNRATDAAIELTAAEEFAEWLHSKATAKTLPMLLSWLTSTKPREVAKALKRLAA